MREAAIKVLLADDDEQFLAALRELIDSQPELEVVATARDGLEAVELANVTDLHAAVVDLHMPRLDGVGTVSRLRHDHPALCLIVLTGDSDAKLHDEAEAAGADAVLEKHELARGLIDRLARIELDGEGRT
jgi:two-component system response regulator DesR